eukprot:TRINITY_DN6728_c0_g1_i1.p1 TRINITY_DN6728_c0_g1~~TRINITY_DN6728_c0_g1_i1.p1  ORF type:complete len:471 (+),score=183.06 TRINITY_DN6728_c0_g1_i1:427-1839(+)
MSIYGQRRRNHCPGHRRGSPAQRHVPRGTGKRTLRPRPHFRQDAQVPHPRHARRHRDRRAFALRSHPRPHHLPPPLALLFLPVPLPDRESRAITDEHRRASTTRAFPVVFVRAFPLRASILPKAIMTTFQELGLSGPTLAALESKGFANPTPIQERTIPLLLAGNIDIVGQAQTGTGKTAAFGLPIIETVREDTGHVQALVLAPTRELAIQVAEEINSLKGKKRIRVLPVYGGQAIHMQLKALKRGVDVVVGTPGRIMDHLSRGTLRLDQLDFFVLDEADEMCNMGFIDDVREILKSANTDRRTLLFSATMAREVMRIAKEFMGDYETVRVAAEQADSLTRHVFHEMADSDRFEALCRVIDAQPEFYGLVFTRTRADADLVAERLNGRGYPAEPIHGDLSQPRREEILNKFRSRRATILVATDVAARGIDVPDLTHVVNFALPQDPPTFVHRTGRTGRAGKQGVAPCTLR